MRAADLPEVQAFFHIFWLQEPISTKRVQLGKTKILGYLSGYEADLHFSLKVCLNFEPDAFDSKHQPTFWPKIRPDWVVRPSEPYVRGPVLHSIF